MKSVNNCSKKLFFLIGILISQVSYGQNPFKLLDKAETLIEKGRLEKALKKIVYAENIKYCTCGLCALQLNKRANMHRYTVYYKTKQYALARQSLDSIHFSNGQIDSLEVLTYQSEYGKDFLSEKIDSSLKESKIDCIEYDCYVEIPLSEMNKTMRFKIYIAYLFEKDEHKRIEKWRKEFMESSIYKMIKEKS